MTAFDGPQTVRFDSFEFDEQSGELRGGSGDDQTLVRLSPQPAKLLAHLIRRRPNIVGADEIRELLWPDVQVEFEQGLHSCVRQVRAALGDSASEPRYVETIPRRGYRFLADVDQATRPLLEQSRPAARRRPRAVPLALAAAVLLIALPLLFRGCSSPPPLRIAVMPFEPIAASSPLPAGNDIAESILARLAEQESPPLEIVGPTTTQAFDDSAERLRELIDQFDIDYVVNARETESDAGPRILVEIIRASDGVHIWVRYLDQLAADQNVAEVIASAVSATCDHASRQR